MTISRPEENSNDNILVAEINDAIKVATDIERQLTIEKNSILDTSTYEEDPTAFLAAAEKLLDDGHHQGVEELTLGLIHNGIDDANIYNLLGRAFFARNTFESAIQAFEMGLIVDPEDMRLKLNLASAQAESGDLAEALASVEEVIHRNEDNAVAFLNRGILHYRDNNEDLACADLSHALHLDPSLEMAENALAKIESFRTAKIQNTAAESRT